jgi:hypothetical protein
MNTFRSRASNDSLSNYNSVVLTPAVAAGQWTGDYCHMMIDPPLQILFVSAADRAAFVRDTIHLGRNQNGSRLV